MDEGCTREGDRRFKGVESKISGAGGASGESNSSDREMIGVSKKQSGC